MSVPSLYYLINTSLPSFGATVLSAYPNASGGFVTSFGLDNMPEKLDRTSLPCMIIDPETDDGGLGFLTFMGNGPQYQLTVRQLLLYKETANLKMRDVLPELLQQLDYYNTAAIAKKFLDTLDTTDGTRPWQVPFKYKPRRSAYTFGDLTCHCIEFTHTFTIEMWS